jgi:hypothetical protein
MGRENPAADQTETIWVTNGGGTSNSLTVAIPSCP